MEVLVVMVEVLQLEEDEEVVELMVVVVELEWKVVEPTLSLTPCQTRS